MSSETGESLKDIAPREYYHFYQKAENGHKTRDLKYAEHWGEFKHFILFPEHLPNLYNSTIESFTETVDDSAELGYIARTYAKLYPKVKKNQWYLKILKILGSFLACLALIVSAYLLLISWEQLTGGKGGVDEKAGVLGIIFAPVTSFGGIFYLTGRYMQEYDKQLRKWQRTARPEWQTKNRDGVFTPWFKSHQKFLNGRGIDPEIGKAIRYVISIYSITPAKYYWQEDEDSEEGAFMLPFSVEDKTGQTEVYEQVEAFKQHLNSTEVLEHLEDALACLTDEEMKVYLEFQNSGLSPKKKSVVLPSKTNYIQKLTEDLHRRTKIITNDLIVDRWKHLLDRPQFASRTMTDNEGNTLTLQEFMSQLETGTTNCFALRGNSGQGKTTFSLQMALHFLSTEESSIEPLIVKARHIDRIEANGSLPLIDKELNPYYRRWKRATERKVLIVDGVDENIRLHSKLIDRLHLTAKFYQTKLLFTGRLNTIPTEHFLSYKLSNFSDEYLDRMIWDSSDNSENRKKLNSHMPEALKQHPMVVFGSAEIIANQNNDFDKANLTLEAICNLIYKRDVDESKKKHGESKDIASTQAVAKYIGNYIGSRILGDASKVSEDNLPYQTARKWELIDDNGINEPLLEGFFLTRAPQSVNDSDLPLIWTKLYLEDRQRWERLVRASLTANNPNLAPISKIINGIDTRNQWKLILQIAGEEWILGDLETRRQIVSRLGFEHDPNGRLLCRQTEHEVPLKFQESDLMLYVISFHCNTLKFETQEWSEDPTWTYLAQQILVGVVERYLNQLKILHRCIRGFSKVPWYWDTSIGRNNGDETVIFNPETYFLRLNLAYESNHNSEIEFEDQTREMVEFLESITQPGHNTKILPRVPGIVVFLLQNAKAWPQMFPLDPFEHSSRRGFTKCPKPFLHLMENAFHSIQSQTPETQRNILHQIYAFIQIANSIHGWKGSLFTIRADDSETIQFMYHLSLNLAPSNLPIFRLMYALLRRAGKYPTERSVIFDPSARSGALEEIEYNRKNGTSGYFLTKPKVELGDLDEYTEKNSLKQLRVVGRRWKTHCAPYVDSYEYSGTHLFREFRGKNQLFELYYHPVKFKGYIYPTAKVTDSVDCLTLRYQIFPNRLYCPIPLHLLSNADLNCILYDDKQLTGRARFSWGVVPWFTPVDSTLLSILKQHTRKGETKSKYEQLDLLSHWLKQFGKVSNKEQATKIAKDEYNIDSQDGLEYFGVCDLREGPDSNGYFYIHILTGTANNDFYVTQDSSGGAWNELNSIHSMESMGDYENVFIRFQVSIEQNATNKHCIIVPNNLVLVCQSCFGSGVPMDADFPTMCQTCMMKFREKGEHSLIRHIRVCYPDLKAMSIDQNHKQFIYKKQDWMGEERAREDIKEVENNVSKLNLFYLGDRPNSEQWEFSPLRCQQTHCVSTMEDSPENLTEVFYRQICQDCIVQSRRNRPVPFYTSAYQNGELAKRAQEIITTSLDTRHEYWYLHLTHIHYWIEEGYESDTLHLTIYGRGDVLGHYIGKSHNQKNLLAQEIRTRFPKQDQDFETLDIQINFEAGIPPERIERHPQAIVKNSKLSVSEEDAEAYGDDLLSKWERQSKYK